MTPRTLVEARLRLPVSDSITLGRWRPDGRVPLAAVDSIWVLHSGVNKAAIVGGAVLGLTFGIFAAEFSASMCESAKGCGNTSAFLGGAGVGIALGATLGAIVGLADQSWERVFP